mgnify:CR=1 FL=1
MKADGSAVFGNDLATLPNFPAEIRAPAGTLPGVSSFQLHFADYDILTPGDRPDVLVAMNPAALKANIGDLPDGGIVIVNTDEFTKRNLTKIGLTHSPLDDGTLSNFSVHPVGLTSLTVEALSGFRNQNIGFIFQLHNLLPEFTAVENVMIPLLIRRMKKSEAREKANRSMSTIDKYARERLEHVEKVIRDNLAEIERAKGSLSQA